MATRHGAVEIDSAPPATMLASPAWTRRAAAMMASSPDAHCRSMECDATVSGRPAASEMSRAGLPPSEALPRSVRPPRPDRRRHRPAPQARQGRKAPRCGGCGATRRCGRALSAGRHDVGGSDSHERNCGPHYKKRSALSLDEPRRSSVTMEAWQKCRLIQYCSHTRFSKGLALLYRNDHGNHRGGNTSSRNSL